MRFKKLEYYRAQIDKCRDLLEDHVNKTADIAKPLNMRTIKYKKLLKRIERNENLTVEVMKRSLTKWLNSEYKA
jgi:hypothetical protein